MEKNNKPWDIASARRKLEATLLSRFSRQRSTGENLMASGDGSPVNVIHQNTECRHHIKTGETSSILKISENKNKDGMQPKEAPNPPMMRNLRPGVMIDLTTEEEEKPQDIFTSISAPVVPQEMHILSPESPNIPAQPSHQKSEVERDSQTIIWSSNGGNLERMQPHFHIHQQRLENPQRRQPKMKKNGINYARSEGLPVSLNIGGRIQHFPRSHIAIHSSHTRVRTKHTGPAQLPIPTQIPCQPDQQPKNNEAHIMPNLHQNFIERLPEQTVLGAIFLNNLIQQSMLDYQNLRNKIYPQLMPQRMMQHHLTANAHTSKSNHCREFCPSRRGYSMSHGRSANQSQVNVTSGNQASTTPVTATFTLPSTSSSSSATIQHHNIRCTAMPNNSTAKQGYQTVQLQSNTGAYYPKIIPNPNTSIVTMSVSMANPNAASQTKPTTAQSSPTGANRSPEKSTKQLQTHVSQEGVLETKKTSVTIAEDVPPTKKTKKTEGFAISRRQEEQTPKSAVQGPSERATSSQVTAVKISNRNITATNTARSIATLPIPTIPFRPASSATFQPISRPIAAATGTTGSAGIRLDAVGSNIRVDLQRPSAPVHHLKKRKRSVTFAETVINQSVSPPIGSSSHRSSTAVSHEQLIPTSKHEKRRLKNALRCAREAVLKMEQALKEARVTKSDGSPTNQISSTVEFSAAANQPLATTTSTLTTSSTITSAVAQQISQQSNQARTPPVATVRLHNACRFYRCQSVTHPNAVLGMIRSCRLCRGNYTVACGNIVNGRCNLNLADVECPRCWNANACYCGEPFSDRYIGGREI